MRRWRFILKGRAIDVFAMIRLLATTEPIEHNPDWWQVRARLIALDLDRQKIPPIQERLN